MRKWLVLIAALAAFLVPAASAQVSIVNGATFQGSYPVSPGGIASAFGTLPGVTQTAASQIPLPAALAGVQVLVNDVAAPLFFVSAGQINFQVPAATPASGPVPIRVTLNGNTLQQGNMSVLPVSPGIFVLDFTNPSLPGAVLNENNAINSQQSRARRGQVIQIFATGQGTGNLLSAAVPDGNAPAQLVTTTQAPDVFVSVAKAQVTFSGLSPQFPGVWQINAIVPDQPFVSGQVPITISYGGVLSNVVSIWVEQ